MLAEDVESVEWHDGVPANGVRTRGRSAVARSVEGPEFRTEISRIWEVGEVVVVEGIARGAKEGGGSWTLRFCNVFELGQDKIQRITMYQAVPAEGT